MSKPDVVLLTGIASHIVNQRETTIGNVMSTFDIDLETAREAISVILLTEVQGRPGFYFLEISIDPDWEELTDLTEDSVITYYPTEYTDPLIYLSAGEAAVSIQMVDQLMSLVDPGSPSATNLTTIRERIVAGAARAGLTGLGGTPARPDAAESVLEPTWEAVSGGIRLEFDYHSAGGLGERVTHREVIPCAIVSEERTYLAALVGERDLRWFRLDRMSNVTVGAKALSTTEINRARRQLRRNSEVHPYEGNTVTFVVARTARWFADRIPGAAVEDHGDTLRVTFTYAGLEWLRLSALRVGTDLIDIEPASVRTELARAARTILEAQ